MRRFMAEDNVTPLPAREGILTTVMDPLDAADLHLSYAHAIADLIGVLGSVDSKSLHKELCVQTMTSAMYAVMHHVEAAQKLLQQMQP